MKRGNAMIEHHCDSLPEALLKDIKNVGKAAVIAGIGILSYAGWTAWRAYRRGSRTLEPSYIVTLGEEVQSFIKDEAEGKVEDLVNEESEEVDSVEGQLAARERMRTRHRKAPFLAKITNLAKNHFGGCPDSTRSNVLAVSKFVYDACKEHNCLPHQTRLIISVVVPLVLSPDQYDLSSKGVVESPSF